MRFLSVLLAVVLCAAACRPSGDGGVPSASARPVFEGCPVMPVDSAWNEDVSAAPVDPRSGALIAAMSPEESLKLQPGTSEPWFGQPVAVVSPDQPPVPIAFGTDGLDYSGESDPGPFPIPLDVHVEGGSPERPDPGSGDRHVVVVQRATCELFELFNAERIEGGFRVSSAARWNLRTGAPRPPGWTSADAAGLPIFPGLLRWEELAAGRIAHALRFTHPRGGGSFVAPANHCVSGLSVDPPFGTRVRLRADFDDSPYSPPTRVLLQALKRYGMILADGGPAWSIGGTSHPGLDAVLRDLRARPIPGAAFEVVELGVIVTDC